MANNIFDWTDKRVMLEDLANSIFKARLYLVRNVEPEFPQYKKELEAIEADLTVAVDKLYELMMRSLDEEGSGDAQKGK